MLKWLNWLDEKQNEMLCNLAYKKRLAGRGPYIIYRCQGCWGAFIERDIVGNVNGFGRDGKKVSGACPRCHKNKWEEALPSTWEYLRFLLLVVFYRGK
jgi:rubrerythrin